MSSWEDDFDKEFDSMNDGFGKFAGAAVVIWLIGLILNFAFWGGLIYFGFWCLQHFGVI